MKTKIDVPYLSEVLKTVGDSFLKDFKKNVIPFTGDEFMRQFNDIEARCMSFLKEKLNAKYADIPFADGEFDFQEQQQPLALPAYWICDSMDGAVQYIQHLPGWTINLVLVEEGVPVFAAIYDALQQELFWAEKGKGAYLNGAPLKVSTKREPAFMLATFDHPSSPQKITGLTDRIGTLVKSLQNQFGIVRNYGPHGLQLAYIAARRIDLFCQEGLDTYNWLPGIVIAQEAGAQINTIDGGAWTWGDDSLFVSAPGVMEMYLAGNKY